MAQTSYPFDGLETTESDYSYMFREFIETGVIGTGSELAVTVGAGMTVYVNPGMAIVRGHAYRSTQVESLPITAAASTARVDTVVLRLDPAANTIVLAVVAGDPSTGTPLPRGLTQTDTQQYEMPLAYVTVPANAVAISAANIQDVRRRTGHRVGIWTNTTRPATPRRAMFGFNTTTEKWEWYNGTAWTDLVTWATLPGRPTTSTIDGRNITVGTAAPSGGSNGDLYFQVI